MKNPVLMKKVIFILMLLSFAGISGCHKSNTEQYQGIFTKGKYTCRDRVVIIQSFPTGLPVNTSLIVSFTTDDSTAMKNLQSDDKITFKIIHYVPDTLPEFAVCLGADFDATIALVQK